MEIGEESDDVRGPVDTPCEYDDEVILKRKNMHIL